MDMDEQHARSDSFDLGDKVPCRSRQFRFAAARHPVRSQNCSIQFISCEHQWRHIEAALQYISNSCFAFDRNPLCDKCGNITVNGALRYFQFFSNLLGGHGKPYPPEQLHVLEKSFSPANDQSPSMLTTRCQHLSDTCRWNCC
jgi:hypothetical protein